MTTMKPLPLAALCGLLLASTAAQAVTCQNNIPPSNPDSIYIDHENGTVTDTRTGLMWKQCVEGRSGDDCATIESQTHFTWGGALSHAQGRTFAGHSDWRLPNMKELRSLVRSAAPTRRSTRLSFQQVARLYRFGLSLRMPTIRKSRGS